MANRLPERGVVDGYAHPAFAPVVSQFGHLFNPASRGGGALAIRLHGETMVDVWAGLADRVSGRPWQRDTVTICFSTTKGVTSTVIHRLADRGLVDYDKPVATYWPEFAAAGKGEITVRQLLSHQAGLYSTVGLLERPSDLLDNVTIENRLAARAPGAVLGHPAYHAVTYGWLLAGLARRVTGLGMAELVRRELAEPLGTDGLCIGTPPDGLKRYAPPISSAPPVRPASPPAMKIGNATMRALGRLERTRPFVEALYLPELNGIIGGPSPKVLETEMPSVNGLLSAHALAKLFSAIACGGEVEGLRLLSSDTVERLSEVQTTARDAVLALRMMWRLGYHRAGIWGYRGTDIFGHFGYGGSGAWADPTTGLSFGFVTNDLKLLQAPVGGDMRIFRLGGLALGCARELVGKGARR